GQDWLLYEAYADGRGADTFTYVVRDRLGAEARAKVIVGVAPSERLNHSPMALKDEAVVLPGRAISVPVLDNDSDPDADVLSLEPEQLEFPDGVDAYVSEDRIVVTADREGEYAVQYVVSDVYGASATG